MLFLRVFQCNLRLVARGKKGCLQRACSTRNLGQLVPEGQRLETRAVVRIGEIKKSVWLGASRMEAPGLSSYIVFRNYEEEALKKSAADIALQAFSQPMPKQLKIIE